MAAMTLIGCCRILKRVALESPGLLGLMDPPEQAPPQHLLSKAWSMDTLDAALVTIEAQRCKAEESTPDSQKARELRIKDAWTKHNYRA